MFHTNQLLIASDLFEARAATVGALGKGVDGALYRKTDVWNYHAGNVPGATLPLAILAVTISREQQLADAPKGCGRPDLDSTSAFMYSFNAGRAGRSEALKADIARRPS